ncbi:MAG TPA: hypothetical protein ENI23_04675, partial [bacterium]|nr:hypothetical protein [bacterium]
MINKNYFKKWRELHPDYFKKWRKRNPNYMKEWRKVNPNKTKEYSKKRYIEKPETIKKYNKKWVKNNPEKKLKIMKRHFKKYGKTFKMNAMEFSYALISWSKTIKKLDSNMCKNCDSTKNINAHHIQPKQVFPELCL